MVRVAFWVPLLLFVLILKQSHEDFDQFRDTGVENIDLEIHKKRIRELKLQNKTFHGECKVSVCVCVCVCVYRVFHDLWTLLQKVIS